MNSPIATSLVIQNEKKTILSLKRLRAREVDLKLELKESEEEENCSSETVLKYVLKTLLCSEKEEEKNSNITYKRVEVGLQICTMHNGH